MGVYPKKRLEPVDSWRQLVQQCVELRDIEPQQQQSGKSQQQHWFPGRPVAI